MPRPARSRRGPTVDVLRIGHRAGRDPRLSTHLALAARAFGARRMYLHPPDPALAARLAAVGKRWGGSFEVIGVEDWRALVKGAARRSVHLTMYGEPLARRERTLRARGELLVIVGGAKVPAELYGRAAYNIAVGHQPHSEVAALAVLLERLGGLPGPGAWPGAEQEVVPQRRGKRVRPARGSPR